MPIIVSDAAKASQPGKITIEPAKFLSYFDVRGFRKYYYHFLFSRMSKDTLYSRYPTDPLVMQWIEKIEHFELGCINPAIVLDQQKGLVATFSNLDNTGGQHPVPVIKITKEKLYLVKTVQLFKGKHIPTVSLYLGYPDSDAKAWVEIEPLIPNCFTDDRYVYEATLKKVSPNSWKCLQQGLEQLRGEEREGLYYIDIDDELVNGA